MQGSFSIGKIAGIDIRIHYTWLFAFLLITWSLASGFFPGSNPGLSPVTYWVIGAISSILLFASVLVHELSHSLVARARGLTVDSITLLIFGGVSSITSEPGRAFDEFLIAVVGPLTSLVLAGVFWVLDMLVGSASGPLHAVLGYLAFTNLLLGVFNILPGFPLDGGRVLRAIIWGATGSLQRATDVASFVGQAFGVLLIFWGLARLLTGDVLGGLWTAFIGWFLDSGAQASRQQLSMQSVLKGVPVSVVMDPSPPLLDPNTTVHDFVMNQAVRRGQRALPVVRSDGELLGIMSLTDAHRVQSQAWATTQVATAMTPVPLRTVTSTASLDTALQEMVDHSLHQLPVVDDGHVVGLLTRAGVLEYMKLGRAQRSTAPATS
jgi:Zn-dependent protease/CBS domain-containing protein